VSQSNMGNEKKIKTQTGFLGASDNVEYNYFSKSGLWGGGGVLFLVGRGGVLFFDSPFFSTSINENIVFGHSKRERGGSAMQGIREIYTSKFVHARVKKKRIRVLHVRNSTTLRMRHSRGKSEDLSRHRKIEEKLSE